MGAMNRSRSTPMSRSGAAARSASGLGEALYRQGRAREAEPFLVNSYRTLTADPNADAGAQAAARERIARFYTDRRQGDKLQALIEETRAGHLLGCQ